MLEVLIHLRAFTYKKQALFVHFLKISSNSKTLKGEKFMKPNKKCEFSSQGTQKNDAYLLNYCSIYSNKISNYSVIYST